MPGYLLNESVVVMCSHGAKATLQPFPRVTIMGQPVMLQALPFTVAGCPNPIPGPCATGQFLTGSLRVTVNRGLALVLSDNQGLCVPTGVPSQEILTQVRVKGQ